MPMIPDHPIIRAMERDGYPPEAPGFRFRCYACDCPIYPGERYYRISDEKTFCEEHGREALWEVADRA